MTGRHLVARAAESELVVPGPFAGRSQGFTRWAVVGEAAGAAHTGFGLCALAAGGRLDAHVHSFEQSVFVLEGRLVLDTTEGSVELGPGDYGLVPVGVAHAARNPGPEPARWADMCAPQPRARFDDDTFFVPSLAATTPVPVDVRDPRTRSFGHIDPANMDPRRQTQDQLAVSASMRTALLEETYLVLEGEVDASFDGEVHRLRPGDVAWAGVGCVHGFSNPADRPVRWLETQAPQPPARHSYRFTRDWDYLRSRLA